MTPLWQAAARPLGDSAALFLNWPAARILGVKARQPGGYTRRRFRLLREAELIVRLDHIEYRGE